MNNLKITNLTMINTTIFNIRGSKLMHSNITSLLVSVTRSSIILFHIPYVIINRRYYPGGSGLPGSSGAGKTPKIPSSSSSESKVPQTPYKNQDLQDGVKSWTKPIDSPYVPPSYVPTQIPTQSSPQLSPTITKGEPKTSSSSAKINEPYYDIKKTMETAQIHQSLPETSVPKTGTQLGSNLDQNPPSHSSDHTPPLLTSPSKTSTIVAPAPTLPHIAKREYAVRTVNKPDKSSPNPQAIKNNPPSPHPKIHRQRCIFPGCDNKNCSGLCGEFKDRKAIGHGTHGHPPKETGKKEISLSKTTDLQGKTKPQQAIMYHDAHDVNPTPEYVDATKTLNKDPVMIKQIEDNEDKK